jgi:hypothetical protein
VTPELYRICARYAGDHLLRLDETAYAIGLGATVPEYSCAIYIAVDATGKVDYVGSVDRAGERGAERRLTEHLRSNVRLRTWDILRLIPLQPGTPHDVVLRIEGRVGAHLNPTRNQRLPKLPMRRRRPGGIN